MKTLLAIPSKGRADYVRNYILRWLRPEAILDAGIDVALFVEPQDYHAYSELQIPKQWLTENDRGLGYAKMQIKKYAEAWNHDCIFKMDDDVRGLCGPSKRADLENSTQILIKAIQEGQKAFERFPALAGISYPYQRFMFDYKKWTRINSRFASLYMIRTTDFLATEQAAVFEDLLNFIDIRERNRTTMEYGWMGVALAVDVGQGVGGHQAFDRKAKALEAKEHIQAKYPWVPWRRVKGKGWDWEPDFRAKAFGGKRI